MISWQSGGNVNGGGLVFFFFFKFSRPKCRRYQTAKMVFLKFSIIKISININILIIIFYRNIKNIKNIDKI